MRVFEFLEPAYGRVDVSELAKALRDVVSAPTADLPDNNIDSGVVTAAAATMWW